MGKHFNDILKLVLSLSIPQAAGLLGAIRALLCQTGIDIWKNLLSTHRDDSSLLYGLALYMMGFSAFLIWRKGLDYPGVKGALAVYGTQLSINVLWSWAFFILRSPLAGLLVIPVLWTSILATILKFRRISRAAAMLLIPYLIWVSFAGYLNYTIWRLNRK
jgi:tryptophan-rich sensory protein